MSQGCKTDIRSNLMVDSRFSRVEGSLISELDLLKANNILDQLLELPGYSEDSSNIKLKEKNTFHLYLRPTINWSLKCELRAENPISR